MHTTASDGTRTPTELVRQLGQTTLRLVAITDHDSLEGIAEARRELANHPQLTLIPGVEMSSDDGESEVHVLGYHLDDSDPGLHEVLSTFRKSREGRGELMVAKLNALGFDITWERVVEIAQGGAIARPHVARALMEKGYVSEIREAFDKYIARGGPAYVEREKMTPEEAVALIRRFGGVPVLAHPTFTKDPPALVGLTGGGGPRRHGSLLQELHSRRRRRAQGPRRPPQPPSPGRQRLPRQRRLRRGSPRPRRPPRRKRPTPPGNGPGVGT